MHHPRLTWFWQLEESNPILWHHAQKVYKTLFVSRSLAREYKLGNLLPAFAYAGAPTAEVKRQKGEYMIDAKGHEKFVVKRLLLELEEVKSYQYEEEKLGAIATIIGKYKRAPKHYYMLQVWRTR